MDLRELTFEALRFLTIKDLPSMIASFAELERNVRAYLIVHHAPILHSEKAIEYKVKTNFLIRMCILHMKAQCCETIEDADFYSCHQRALALTK